MTSAPGLSVRTEPEAGGGFSAPRVAFTHRKAPAYSLQITLGDRSPQVERIAPEVQAKLRQIISEQRDGLVSVLEFSETDEVCMQAVFPDHTEEDFVEIRQTAKRYKKYDEILERTSCSDNPNYGSVRLAVRVVGFIGLGTCQVLIRIGTDWNSSTLKWIGTSGQLAIGVGMACSEVWAVRKRNQKLTAERDRNIARLALDKLLQASKKGMETNARALLRQWVALTADRAESGPLATQFKDYVVHNWNASLPRLRRVAQEKLILQKRVDDLLEPMTTAVRAIELAYDLSQTTFSRDIGDTSVEFEQNRFSIVLARLQDKFLKQQSKPTAIASVGAPPEPLKGASSSPMGSPAVLSPPVDGASGAVLKAELPSSAGISAKSSADPLGDGTHDFKDPRGMIEAPKKGDARTLPATTSRRDATPRHENTYAAARKMGKHIRQRTMMTSVSHHAPI